MRKNIFLFVPKPEKTFIIFGVVFGILLSVITSPFQAADEGNHFYRAFQISELQMIAERKQNKIGGFLPKSLINTVDKISNNIPFHPEIKQKPENILSLLNLPLESSNRVFVHFPNTSLYSPIPYLPQATGILLGKITGMSPIMLMYIGRIFNLLAWVFLIYMSIKVIPFFKWTFFLLALTPTSLFQASSLSADAMTNGISFLLISIFLHYAFIESKRINIIYIFTLSPLLSLSKMAYFPIMLLYLLIPKKKIGSKKKYFTVFALLALLNLGVIAFWALITKGLYIPLQPNVSPSQQFLFILSHPLNFLKVVIGTVLVQGSTLLEQYIGVLGWIDTRLPGFQVYSYLVMLFFVAIASKEKNIVISFKQKVIIFSIFILNVIIIMSLIYLSWTAVGGNRIDGLLGRYFIPIFTLLFLLFYSHNKFRLNINKISGLITGYSLFSNTLTVYVVLCRYYF